MKKSDITVMVVEDDNSLRQGLVEAIKKFGYKITSAAKPDEALSLIKIKPIHAAIVDVLLPKMNGLDLVKEIRLTSFAQSPVIFISGIFKDKNKIQESLKKSGALDYLVKPFDLKILKQSLDSALAPLISTEQISLPAILSKAFGSVRERIKALENIEELSGFDLPFVLSILMADGVTGNLNISDERGEIFGITMVHGTISKVDSAESQNSLTNLILKKGFVTTEELAEYPKEKRKNDIIRFLVSESLASPHALYPIIHEQILAELKGLFKQEKLRFNFSKDEINEVGNFLSFEHCVPLFDQTVAQTMTDTYLESFYSIWLEHPMRRSERFATQHPLLKTSTILAVPDLINKVTQELTLEELLNSSKERSLSLRAIHMMALCNLIYFDDVKVTKSKMDHFQKLVDTFQKIDGKNPFEIFAYFGASPHAKINEVEKIYREFAKSNHPDLVPASAPPDLKMTVHKVFSLVSGAHDVLINEEKRKKYFDELKNIEFQKQIKAESLADQALGTLLKGKVKDSLALITEALSLYKSPTIICYYGWAKLKSYPGATPSKVIKEIAQSLDSIAHQDRRTAVYQHVIGLLKKAQGDFEGATNFFERAQMLDPSFTESAKESEALKAHQKKSFDLLNGDITSIVSNIFKRK